MEWEKQQFWIYKTINPNLFEFASSADATNGLTNRKTMNLTTYAELDKAAIVWLSGPPKEDNGAVCTMPEEVDGTAGTTPEEVDGTAVATINSGGILKKILSGHPVYKYATERGDAVGTHWTCVREVAGSIPSLAILISVFHDFPKPFQANAGMVLFCICNVFGYSKANGSYDSAINFFGSGSSIAIDFFKHGANSTVDFFGWATYSISAIGIATQSNRIKTSMHCSKVIDLALLAHWSLMLVTWGNCILYYKFDAYRGIGTVKPNCGYAHLLLAGWSQGLERSILGGAQSKRNVPGKIRVYCKLSITRKCFTSEPQDTQPALTSVKPRLTRLRGVGDALVKYRNTTGDPYVLKVPGCEKYCPLETFFQLTEEYIPKNWEKECRSSEELKIYSNNRVFSIEILLRHLISVPGADAQYALKIRPHRIVLQHMGVGLAESSQLGEWQFFLVQRCSGKGASIEPTSWSRSSVPVWASPFYLR
ncbi:hypothetical protein PR048_012016 [Dryococelus australis]|uniref:Uncharacterized protein n=1 Tax=Dryococelus australis TaxID=614101 RepID=A0ABQ9HN99_9NEOP|nr:hypothetical protein PR048_012016 [Dryococelus australis]